MEAADSTNGSAALPHHSAAAYIRGARSRWRSVTAGPRGGVEGPKGPGAVGPRGLRWPEGM